MPIYYYNYNNYLLQRDGDVFKIGSSQAFQCSVKDVLYFVLGVRVAGWFPRGRRGVAWCRVTGWLPRSSALRRRVGRGAVVFASARAQTSVEAGCTCCADHFTLFTLSITVGASLTSLLFCLGNILPWLSLCNSVEDVIVAVLLCRPEAVMSAVFDTHKKLVYE